MLPAVREEIRFEPSNTRGWPKTQQQLDWALLHVREGLSVYHAAVKAGYTEKTAQKRSYELTTRMGPFIAFLQEKKNVVAEREFNVTTERVLEEMSAIGLSDWNDYVVPKKMHDGSTRLIGRPLNELTSNAVRAVQSFDIVELKGMDGKPVLDYRYKLHSKREALVDLGKHLGMFNERILLEMRHRHDHRHKLDFTNVPANELGKLLDMLNKVESQALVIEGESTEVDSSE